jgi:histidinol-phosphate phosphatase family protein
VSSAPPHPARARFVFLDRDGTLVRDTGYVHRLADYALLPGVVPALRRLAAAGFGLAVVTNQSGIGRGLFTLADYRAFEAHLEADLARQGVPLAGSFFCPHTPEAGCACRKPAPGLLLRARDVLGATLEASFVVGDALRDAEAAAAAGCRGALLVGAAPDAPLPPRTWRAASLAEAVDKILGLG